jgi:hypothetical protein
MQRPPPWLCTWQAPTPSSTTDTPPKHTRTPLTTTALCPHLNLAGTMPGSSSSTASNLSMAAWYSFSTSAGLSAISARRHMARPQLTSARLLQPSPSSTRLNSSPEAVSSVVPSLLWHRKQVAGCPRQLPLLHCSLLQYVILCALHSQAGVLRLASPHSQAHTSCKLCLPLCCTCRGTAHPTGPHSPMHHIPLCQQPALRNQHQQPTSSPPPPPPPPPPT